MVLKDYWKSLSLLLLCLILSRCSSLGLPELKQIEVKTVEVERNIPIQNRPRQLDMDSIKWYVVTPENFEDFKKRFTDENGDLVGYVLSVRDYETLALNMAEIKRYIEQQKEIIIYYEEAVKPRKKEEEEK